jgi:NADPH2:quinone reductase
MQLEELDLPSPGPGEVLLEQTAIGVNPLDVNQRKGLVPIALPSGLGLEGAGSVAAVGSGVSGLKSGTVSATPPVRWARMPVRACSPLIA